MEGIVNGRRRRKKKNLVQLDGEKAGGVSENDLLRQRGGLTRKKETGGALQQRKGVTN